MNVTRGWRRSGRCLVCAAWLLLVWAAVGTSAACHTPAPRPWLRYQLNGPSEFTAIEDGTFAGSMFGADVRIELNRPNTSIVVIAANPTAEPVSFRIGPNAGKPRAAIGEVLQRRIAGETGVGPDTQPYTALQPVAVDPGMRATFYLDAPDGREPQLGQYMVLVVEATNKSGDKLRQLLPVIATMSGTVPTDQ